MSRPAKIKNANNENSKKLKRNTQKNLDKSLKIKKNKKIQKT